MSPPDTDLETQEGRHKPVLTVLRGVIAFTVIALIAYVAYEVIDPFDGQGISEEEEEASPAAD